MSEISGIKVHQDITRHENPPGVIEKPLTFRERRKTMAYVLQRVFGDPEKSNHDKNDR